MISREQNSDRQLQRLAAQRQLYITAKNVLGWQVVLGGPVAIAWAVAVLLEPSLKATAAAWGLIVTLADVVWLTPWQKRLRLSAATIQEAFDCDVLCLDWNDIKVGKRPNPELIKEQADKYQLIASSMPGLTDWYPPVVDTVPIAIGRIACQRANCWWDANQRKLYANWIIGVVVVVFIAVSALSLPAQLTLDDFLLRVVAPLAPALVLGVRQYSDQREVAKRLDTLIDHCDSLWGDARAGLPAADLTRRSRVLQDEIFDNRRRSPPVFDFVFRHLREDYEKQMNFAADELIDQIRSPSGVTTYAPVVPSSKNGHP